MKTIILGAGPAGLAAAHGLSGEDGRPCVVLERAEAVGGLARTLRWGAHGSHDLGPHKLFTLDQALMKRVLDLLPESDWLVRPKTSRIYMKGAYLPYPPSPFSLAGIYGLPTFARMILDYGLAKLAGPFRRTPPSTFEGDLSARVGTTLYEALFKPIALKIWGDPKNLDVKLSKGRIQTPSVLEILSRLLGRRKAGGFEALSFHYPKGGLQRLWDSIQERCRSSAEFRVRQEVVGLDAEGSRIVRVRVKDLDTGEPRDVELGPGDDVLSTLPLAMLPRLLGSALSPAARERIERTLVLNDLLLVFLKLDRPSLIEDSWIFVPDPEIAFHRVCEQRAFDPGMTPAGAVVCCELMSSEVRPLSGRTDQELCDDAERGLRRMGLGGFTVLDRKVVRLPRSYPVFRPGFEPELEAVLAELDRFENFRTIGRQGGFNYIGTLDAMDIGYGAAKWLWERDLARRRGAWSAERERTRHYPVLD